MSRFAAVGLPVWLLVDGTWSELSQLADTVPEGYKISAYLIFSISLGNTVPLIGGVLLKDASQRLLKRTIMCVMVIACLCGFLMSLFWSHTVNLGGKDHSVPLFCLFTVLGACACLSNVTHFTFVSLSSAVDTTALAVGMALGSMTAGILAIIQGTVLPQLTVSLYYIVLSCVYFPCLWIVYTTPATSTYDDSHSREDGDGIILHREQQSKKLLSEEDQKSSSSNGDKNPMMNAYIDWKTDDIEIQSVVREDSSDTLHSHTVAFTDEEFIRGHIEFLCIQLINSFLSYGVVPSLISYACGKYTNGNTVLLFSTACYCIIDPLCKLSTNVDRVRIKGIEGFRKVIHSIHCLIPSKYLFNYSFKYSPLPLFPPSPCRFPSL